MTPPALLEKSRSIRSYASDSSCVSFTDLARGASWRKRLPKMGILQITDRGKSAGWIVSDQEMRRLEQDVEALQNQNEQLERQLELAQIEAIFAARPKGNPQTGPALKDAAKNIAHARRADLERITDDAD